MKYYKTRIIITLIGSMSIFGGACIYAQETRSYSTFTFDIVQSTLTETSISSTSELVNNFCNTLYTNSERKRYDENTSYLYDATQSLFMIGLCEKSENTRKQYFQHIELSSYGLECSGSLLQDGDDCQTPLYRMIHHLYNRIISDMVDAMTAQAYGYNGWTTTGEKLDEISFTYLSGYASTRKNICSNAKNCIIPETRETLKQYLSKARQLVQKRKRIQQEIPIDQELCKKNNRKNGSYTIIACGLNANAPLTQQHNLISNELVWYTAFVQYYAYQLMHNPKIQPSITSNNIDKIIQQGSNQATELLHNHQIATKATHNSIQQVGQIHASFPIHIHLTAYYEVIKKIRNQLARIYTPLHQLYYKLRNVQSQS